VPRPRLRGRLRAHRPCDARLHRQVAGYSGTPLAAKLGIKPGAAVRLVGAPEAFEDLLAPLPDGAVVRRRGPLRADVVVLFTASYAVLAREVPRLGQAVHPDRALWVAWPKKASGVPTDVTEDSIRDVALPLGLVDNKVCAVSDVWSGLRLVWRKERR
jgi:hypothetical protein